MLSSKHTVVYSRARFSKNGSWLPGRNWPGSKYSPNPKVSVVQYLVPRLLEAWLNVLQRSFRGLPAGNTPLQRIC